MVSPKRQRKVPRTAPRSPAFSGSSRCYCMQARSNPQPPGVENRGNFPGVRRGHSELCPQSRKDGEGENFCLSCANHFRNSLCPPASQDKQSEPNGIKRIAQRGFAQINGEPGKMTTAFGRVPLVYRTRKRATSPPPRVSANKKMQAEGVSVPNNPKG